VNSNEIVNLITSNFDGVVVKFSWDETSFFYNPDHLLPHGVYFCTMRDSVVLNIQRACEATIDLAKHLISIRKQGLRKKVERP
jgi:hypothetical protein